VEEAVREASETHKEQEASTCDSEEPEECKGQWHHLISKRIFRALDRPGTVNWTRRWRAGSIPIRKRHPRSSRRICGNSTSDLSCARGSPMDSEQSAVPRFFVLQAAPLWTRYDVEVDEVEPIQLGKGASCPKCGDAIGSRTWLGPYRVNLVLHGEELGDYLKTVGHDFLVSERFATAFREEGLTGLDGFHPVEVLRVRGRRRGPKPATPPAYVAVRACYSQTAVDLTRSRIRWDEPPTCDECRSTIKDGIFGFSLEPSTWQGEDIFRPRGLTGCLTVSERFERFVARHGFTNMRLTPTEEYVWDALAPKPASSP
jgi:hypothetical protein